jgi:hypothetical protein
MESDAIPGSFIAIMRHGWELDCKISKKIFCGRITGQGKLKKRYPSKRIWILCPAGQFLYRADGTTEAMPFQNKIVLYFEMRLP